MTGPAITDWKLLSSADLTLTDIRQRQLRLNIRGSGNVVATGAVETVGLKISGSGNAQLKSLVAKSAEIEIRGSGSTQLTAETNANVLEHERHYAFPIWAVGFLRTALHAAAIPPGAKTMTASRTTPLSTSR